MSQQSFRIRHGHPEYIPTIGLIPAGPIQVIPSNFCTLNYSAPGLHRSRKGVEYRNLSVGFRSLKDIPKPEGFPLGLEDSYGRQYGQKHGTIYRIN